MATESTNAQGAATAVKAPTTSSTATTRRTRRSKKRLRFKTPERPAPSIREIWERASAKEKEEAHRMGVAILETWVGRTTRAEAAAKLGIPQVRLHQLSQLATSGLIAGLLKQPKSRRRSGLYPEAPDEATRLKKECERLGRENDELKRLADVLRGLPRLGRPEKEAAHGKGGSGSSGGSGSGTKG